MSDPNPYLAPTTAVADWQDPNADLVGIREQHIRHEVLLKSIGSLYWLTAVVCLVGTIATVSTLSQYGSGADGTIFLFLSTIIYGGMGLASAIVGFGFRALKPWVKFPGTVLSGVGLLGIPVGTIINGYILYLIWCDKGKRVLAEDYAGIIAQTPQVKYKRTVGDWIALGIVVLFLLVLLVSIAVGYFSAR